MTEVEWLTGGDPHRLINQLESDANRRKLRHFVCLCVRHSLPEPLDEWVPGTLASVERRADDPACIDPGEWASVLQRLDDRRPRSLSVTPSDLRQVRLSNLLELTVGEDVYDDAHEVVERLKEDGVDLAAPLRLLRDIFGNPFRPVIFSPNWRTDTAVMLAKQMYESRDSSAMPILADAIQDAGCDNEDVLNHCRGPGPHVRGCWVLDAVLGKA